LAAILVCFAAPACLGLLMLLQGCSNSVGTVPRPLSHPTGAQNSSLEPANCGNEELWVIARGQGPAPSSEQSPGSGALLAEVDEKEVPMPLKHTEVKASITGYIGSVNVTQTFLNPYSRKIEAVYVFPLPHNAAVNEFIMTIGERRIRGIIRERKEAEQLYQRAKERGYVASLLTEARPNIFTQRIANLEPAKEIDVNIKYFHALEYVDGWHEFVFPMVVGPRFNPPGTNTGIGAVARRDAGASGQDTEIQYLRPKERTSHEISLKVEVDAGVAIEQFECKTHQVTSEAPSGDRLSISLAPSDSLPNKEFVLRYRVAGEGIKPGLLVHRDERGGFFSLLLYPPQELQALHRQPLEMVFVLDCSGSMSGRPLVEAKAAVERGLRMLQPEDSFQLITFSVGTSSFGQTPLIATPENVERALAYLHSMSAEGGTMMLEAVKAALEFPHDPRRLRFVCFLTDGSVGNETEILGAIHYRLGAARIFSFGIGSSVNRYLIDQMARTGRGAVAYLGPNDSAAQIMEDFFNRISHPCLTDVAIDWGGLHVTEVFPSALPDLFVGRPVMIAGRFAGDPSTTIRVNGLAAGQPVQVVIPASLTDARVTHSELPALWARMKIADLANRSAYEAITELPEKIRRVALDYNLLSSFTSFVAVDSTSRTEGSAGVTVPVAVPVPEGVSYKKAVDEK
jgi:Ca-activated chloride channel family protein